MEFLYGLIFIKNIKICRVGNNKSPMKVAVQKIHLTLP